MPQRTAGRHRRPRTRLAPATALTVPALTGTVLGAALIAGGAVGAVAASAGSHHATRPVAVTRPFDPAATAGTDLDGTDLDGTDSDGVGTDGSGPIPGEVIRGVLSADPIEQKSRAVVVTTQTTGAEWVNPNPTAVVTSCFGMRWGRLHAGVDLAAPDGTPIVAAGAGVVVRAGVAEGYGNAVLIDHGNGYLTHYGHLSKITVTVGEHVTAGQQIGNEGSTGHSTGPHLHFEVHQGFYQNPIEPTEWMHQHGVDIPGCVPLD